MIDFNVLNDRMQAISTLATRLDHEPIQVLARFLSERIAHPESFVVMLGETSSGKTTLLNGLLGKEMLKTSAKPTTGTIVEVMSNPNEDVQREVETYYAINKDATMEEISLTTFGSLALEPDADLHRLRVIVPTFPHDLRDMRLFDTPGYGSIVEHHEAVLKDFIPNSDVIVYVVSHRIGFKQNDYEFLKYVNELIGPDTEVLLVINRVPEGIGASDTRIEEIRGYAEDCLHRKLRLQLVRSSYREGQPVLPSEAGLWNDIHQILEQEERKEALQRAFIAYQDDILLEMKGHVVQRLVAHQMSAEEEQDVLDAMQPLLETEERALERINVVFDKLNGQLAKLFDGAANTIKGKIDIELDDTNKWASKDECIGFVQNHMFPLHVKNETKSISNWIQDELERLDEEIFAMLNTAVVEFEKKVVLKSNLFQPLLVNISNRLAHKAAGNGLNAFFKQFGGAGGAGAGVANAAKKGLKQVGKMFNKTFSRDTHNALASFLKKMGATSTKAVTAAAAVIVEGIFYMIDSLTWQPTLKRHIRKALDTWRDETITMVSKDLTQLKEHNMENVRAYFEVYRESMPEKKHELTQDVQLLQEMVFDINDILSQKDTIEVTHYER
ncbi:dynamin family protein [Paenibacillus sp. 37]|uniref:dynamin family protein n=1 Tax=Paenibacillus sp. 37 TaxID=2607911 RepID=UPI00122E3E16|nr:dynamin family protein [Paenibacillus sp. 37]